MCSVKIFDYKLNADLNCQNPIQSDPIRSKLSKVFNLDLKIAKALSNKKVKLFHSLGAACWEERSP